MSKTVTQSRDINRIVSPTMAESAALVRVQGDTLGDPNISGTFGIQCAL